LRGRAKERLASLLRQGRIEVEGGAHPALVWVIDGPHLTVSSPLAEIRPFTLTPGNKADPETLSSHNRISRPDSDV
jgi:hypothetical protein